jgi:hypothetical protein
MTQGIRFYQKANIMRMSLDTCFSCDRKLMSSVPHARRSKVRIIQENYAKELKISCRFKVVKEGFGIFTIK